MKCLCRSRICNPQYSRQNRRAAPNVSLHGRTGGHLYKAEIRPFVRRPTVIKKHASLRVERIRRLAIIAVASNEDEHPDRDGMRLPYKNKIDHYIRLACSLLIFSLMGMIEAWPLYVIVQQTGREFAWRESPAIQCRTCVLFVSQRGLRLF